MALNRDKFRKIVGGITTPETEEAPTADSATPVTAITKAEKMPPTEQGGESAVENNSADEAPTGGSRRFAKRGRPKGRKEEPTPKTRKVKVSLFLSEVLVNDLYDWAYDDKIHPGEMFERALKSFHEKEAKRRNAGKE